MTPDAAEPLHSGLALEREELAAFCSRRGIRRLSFFGSRLTGRHRPGSDVDLLAESGPGRMPTLLDMADMEQEPGRKLGGLRVDLRTPGDLSRYFRDDVLRDAAARYGSR